MTTQSPQTNDAIRRLRRRTSDRVIGGVAGGLGDYLNVDPLLIRIGFVGLMVFGGAGLVLYVIAWLLIPAEGHDDSTVERILRRIGLRTIGWVALAIFVVILLSMPEYGPGFPGFIYFPTWFWALVVLVIGVLVLRREGPARAATVAPAQVPGEAIAAAPVIVQPRPAPKPRGPLGWYTLGAILLAIGLLAIIQNVVQLEVELAQFFGVALLILGIGLVIGAWWGRARLLILLGLLLLPLGVMASFVTAPLEGGFGDQTFTPASIAQLRPEYRMVGGRMTLDLTQLPRGAGQVRIDASVAIGQLVVIVPPKPELEVTVSMGGGGIGFLDQWQGGASITDHLVSIGRGPELLLNLETGVGEIRVAEADANGRCIGCDCGWFTSCAYPLDEEYLSEQGY